MLCEPLILEGRSTALSETRDGLKMLEPDEALADARKVVERRRLEFEAGTGG